MPTNEARNIYRYHDGTRTVAADPAVLWRGLNAACRERGTTWDKLTRRWMELAPAEGDSEDAAREKADAWLALSAEIVAVVRSAFGLAPLDADGGGTTEDEVMAALASFVEWREKKGSSTASSPPSSGPTAGDPPASSNPPTDPSPTTTSTACS